MLSESWFLLKKEHFSSFQTKNGINQGVRWLKSCAYDCCKWCDMPRQLDLPKKIIPGRSSLKSQKIMNFTQKRSFFSSFQTENGINRGVRWLKSCAYDCCKWCDMPRQLDLPKNIMPGRSCLKSQKNHDFHSKKGHFSSFLDRRRHRIGAYDGLKFAPTITANNVTCLVNYICQRK